VVRNNEEAHIREFGEKAAVGLQGSDRTSAPPPNS
jgi:hypothetical protein